MCHNYRCYFFALLKKMPFLRVMQENFFKRIKLDEGFPSAGNMSWMAGWGIGLPGVILAVCVIRWMQGIQGKRYFAARRFVIEEVKRYENAYPYVIGLVLRTTGNIVNVEVTHRERAAGESGYTLGKLLALWFNGFTAFSVKPLRIATISGALCAMAGFLYGIYTIVKKIFINPPGLVTGFSALMSVLVFMGGMLMLMLGLVGEYMGRMYLSMNRSPQYVIREMAGKPVENKENEKEK